MTLLQVNDLRVHFPTRRGVVRAVDGVSLSIRAGETLGLVGESGCGKSTLGRAIMGLVPVTAGRVLFGGDDITHRSRAERRTVARRLQIVFQDPFAALNPRARIGRIVGEPLSVHRIGAPGEREATVNALLSRVGLTPDAAHRLPHEFSGGQRQRIGIARALALSPELLICDEPVSALDLSVQAQILNLFADLQASLGLAYLFISHDLAVVRHVSHRIAVMYLGRIIETGDAATIFRAAGHPYTRALLASAPTINGGDALSETANGGTPDFHGEFPVLADDVPGPLSVPSGCRFHPRCPMAIDRCKVDEPVLTERSDGRFSACHRDREDVVP